MEFGESVLQYFPRLLACFLTDEALYNPYSLDIDAMAYIGLEDPLREGFAYSRMIGVQRRILTIWTAYHPTLEEEAFTR